MEQKSKQYRIITSAPQTQQDEAHKLINTYMKSSDINLVMLSEQLKNLFQESFNKKNTGIVLKELGYHQKPKSISYANTKKALAKSNKNRADTHAQSGKLVLSLIDKMKDIGLTKDQFAKEWQTNGVGFFKKKYGLPQYHTELLVQHFKLNANRKLVKTWKNALTDFKNAGYTEEDIKKHIFVEHNTIKATEKWISEIIGWSIGEKRFENMRKALDIKLTKKQVANRQGTKSRDEKQAAFDRLARSGYTVESLASEYENNLSMTKSEVLDIINAPLTNDEPKFTERWLARYIDPLTTDVRKGHVSREELNFRTTFQALYPKLTVKASDHTVLSGNRELDMYIPELNLAIEFNGDYWHSDNFFLENYGITADEYHQVKFDECKEAGIQLLFVWESAWTTHKQVILRAINDFIQHNRVSKVLTLLSNENNELDLIIEKELNYYSKLGKLTDNKVFLSNIRQRKDEYLKVV